MNTGMVRKPRNYIFFLLAATIAMALSTSANADLVKYTNHDAWFTAVGGQSEVTTIGFTGFAAGTIITNQYLDFGVTFTDGNDRTSGPAFDTWPRDGWGLDGNADIDVQFEKPLFYIAVDFPGDMRFELYFADQLVGDAIFVAGGHGNFAGVISTDKFDKVVLSDISDPQVFIDDLHFATIPSPPTLIVASILLFRPRNRRDRN